jgi:hypothetical protein
MEIKLFMDYNLCHSTGFIPVPDIDEAVRTSGGGPCLPSADGPGLKMTIVVLDGIGELYILSCLNLPLIIKRIA